MKNQVHTTAFVGDNSFSSFAYKEYGVRGVGRNRYPMVSMDNYIDHSNDDDLHIECCKGLALCNDYKTGMVYGALPPEEVARLGGHDCWSEVLANLDSIDPTGKHKRAIEEIMAVVDPAYKSQTLYKYAYYALGAAIPWFFALYLKHTGFFQKTEDNGTWTDAAKYFPNLIKYIDTLPFKAVGRVLFFTTYPNAGVITHRDSIVEEHSDHNINLFFSAGHRPSYVWDEKTKEKTYLPLGARSYFFNNRDYHGVDPEPVFRYTVRVDGTFTDEMCEKLGLEDGYTWKWDYENAKP